MEENCFTVLKYFYTANILLQNSKSLLISLLCLLRSNFNLCPGNDKGDASCVSDRWSHGHHSYITLNNKHKTSLTQKTKWRLEKWKIWDLQNTYIQNLTVNQPWVMIPITQCKLYTFKLYFLEQPCQKCVTALLWKSCSLLPCVLLFYVIAYWFYVSRFKTFYIKSLLSSYKGT